MTEGNGGAHGARGNGVTVPPGASVCVTRGFYEGLELPIDREWVVVGRGRTADVLIADPTMSRAHAAIAYDGQVFTVEDLGSTNGTRVNGARRQRAELTDGDELQLGKLRLVLRLPG